MKRLLPICTCVLLAAGLLAACSQQPEGGSRAGSGAVDTVCLTDSQSDVRARSAELPLVAPAAPLDLTALSGKAIWYVTVTFNQFSSDWVAGLKEAAAEANVEVVTFDGQGSVNRFNEGISQAVAQNASGIIVAAIDPAVIESSLAKAAAAGIPVMNAVNNDPEDPPPAGMYGNFTTDFTRGGETAASWVLADSGCAANLAILTTSSVRVWQNVAAGAQQVFKTRCPQCRVTVLDFDIANMATDIGSKLQAALIKDPGIDYVLAAGDAIVPFIDPILSAAGSNAKVIGHDGLSASIEAIASRKGQDATIAIPPFSWLGWIAFDEIARKLLGAESPDYVIPTRLVDTANVGDGSAGHLFPAYDGYRAAFIDSWNRR